MNLKSMMTMKGSTLQIMLKVITTMAENMIDYLVSFVLSFFSFNMTLSRETTLNAVDNLMMKAIVQKRAT